MSLYDDEKKYGDGTNAAIANLADNKMQEAEAISANAEVVAGSVDDQDTKPDYETGVDVAPEQAAPVVKDDLNEEPQATVEVNTPEMPVVDAPEPIQETKAAPAGFDDWWNSIDNGVKFGIRDAGCDVQRAYKLAPQEDKDAFAQTGQGFNLFYENPDTKEYEGMYKVGSDGAKQMRDWYEELTPEGENMRRFYDLMEVDGYYRLVPKDITGNGARSVYYLAFRDAEDPESATLMTAGDLSVDKWGKFAADSTNPFLIEVREFNAGDEVKEGCSYQVDILDENGEVVDSNVYDAEQFAQIDPASLTNATVHQLDYSLNVAPGELTDRIKGFDHTPETILSQYNKRNILLEEEKNDPWLNGDWQKQFGDKVKGESPMDRASAEYQEAKKEAERRMAEHNDKLRPVAKVINAYDAKYVNRGLERVDDMINEHMKGMSPDMRNFIATHQAATIVRSMTATSPMPAISGLEPLMMGKGEVATELTKQAQLDAAKEYFSQAKAIHESPWDDASGWDSFWAGVRDAVIDEDTWIDGMKEAWANETMAPLLAKIRSVAGNLSSNTLYKGDFFDVIGEDGKPVFSEEEKMLLQAFLAKEDAQMSHLKFANDFYQDGVSAFKSALFTAKFLIGSGSAGTVGESLAENLAKSLQKMGPRFGKFVAYGIANLVEGGLRTVMTPGTFSRAHANSLIEPTAFGYKVAEGKELMANMAKSYVDDTIENWSELVFRGAASGLLDDAVLNFIGPETRAALKALNQSPMGRAARATGMGSMPEEVAEEWVGAATRAIFLDKTDKNGNGIPDSFENFAKLENQMHMAISFSLTMIPGGAMMEVNRAAKALDFQDYMARTEEGLRKAGREDLVATWRELINGSDYEQLQQILVDVVHTTAKMDATNAAQIAENAIKAIHAKSVIRAIDQRTPQATMEKIDAAAASLQERLGGAFVMDGDKVRVITGANGTRRFVYTKPEKGGKKPMQEVILQEGVAPQIVPYGYADAMLADESATDFQSEQVTTRNQYILGTLVEGENAAENDRMANERRTQIAALQQGMQVGTTINIGTLETPNMVVVGGASQDGKSVMVQDANGQIVPISWEIYAATPEINQPIHVKTQEEYFNEQVERQRQRNAEAREQGVKDADEQHYDKQHIATPVAKEEPVQETGREEAEATVAAHEEASTEASQGKIAMEAAERDREVGAFYEKDADGNVVMGPDGKPAIMWEQLWNANPGLWAKYKDKENGGNTAATNKALRDNLDGLVIRAREVENALAETPGDETLQRERAALEARRNQLASIIDTREQASIQKEAMQAAKQLATEGEEAEDARAYVESKVAEAQGVLADVQSNEPAYQQGQSLEEYTNARKIYREALRKAQRNLAVWERVAATHQGMVTGQQFREQVQQTELQPSQIEGMSDEQYTAALAAQAAYNDRQTESGRKFQEMVAKRVAEWKEKYGVKVNVINSIEEIPETEKAAFAKAYQEMARGGNGLQGWMSPSTGEAYVFAPLLTSIGELDKTLMHEVVAHKGLRNIMGAKAYDELCDDVWANVMSDYQKEFFMNYARSTGRYDETKAADMIKLHRAAADEFLAFTSEQNTPEALENLSFGEKLTGGIRDALRSLGFSGELNNKDLKWMLARSLQKSDEEDGRNLMRKISQSIGGTIDGSSETRFSVTAQAEGAGLQVLKDDGDGNVAFVHPVDGRIFNANNLLTAADLKSMPESVMQYMIADAHAVGTVDDAKEWMLWNRYAMMLNAILIKGSAENGGFEYLASQWQWIAESVYKTVAPNSDTQYSYSLDITRVCKKNEAVINSIAETQRRLGYGITPGQIMDIYLSTIEEGYQVPCPVCYVFSRYIRNGKYATIMINGQEKYGSQLVDPRTLSEAEYNERVKYWKYELKKAQKLAEQNKDIIAKANQDITTLLDDIDNLAKQLTDPDSGLTDEQKESIKAEIRALDAKYRAALNVVSQSSLDSWITQFAIHQVKENGRKKWVLYDDTYQGFPKEMALDLRETATVMREYPAIQRYRNSRGAAAGKEITFASNNDLGDLPMALGSVGATKSLARPKEMSPEEWRSLKQDEYGSLKGGVKNLYQQAFAEKDPAVKKALLDSARKRFKAAHLYAKQQSLRGGQRMWSWSDNIERLGPDVFVNLMQLEMLGGALQAYSKQLEGIKHVASLGGYVNGSLMGKGNGYKEITADEIETGEDGALYQKGEGYWIGEPGKNPQFFRTPVYEQDGKYYVLEFDDVVGVQPFSGWGEDSKGNKVWHKGLFELNRELDKAGNIIVGMNDLHIRMAMADGRIFFIIPWHSSGANNHILSQMYQYLNVLYDVKQSQDYTKVQEEKRFKSAKAKDEELTEEEKMAQEGNEDVEEEKTPGIKQEVIDFWEDHYNNAREYAGQMLAGKDFECGTAPIESGKDGQLSEGQDHYRQLRDAIFIGVKVRNGVDKNGKDKFKTVAIDKLTDADTDNTVGATPAWFDEIMNDAFLRQAYMKVREVVGETGFMTTTDCKYIYPYEYWDMDSTYETADVNAARYLEYCRRLGYKPKFCGKLDGKPENDFGNFVDDKGYWKLLIDRRMYDRFGNFQDLTPVTAEKFTPDLVDPVKTAEEFEVTRVADEAGTNRIVDATLEREAAREGGIAKVDYSLDLSRAIDIYKGALNDWNAFKNTLNEEDRRAFRAVEDSKPMDEAFADAIAQSFSSAATSINKDKLPSAFGKIKFVSGTVNLDLGGGKFDNATEFLKGQGVENLVFDPFNRDSEHNRKIAEAVRDGKVDTVTCNNCLNVIDSERSRDNVILQASKAIKPDGVAYFSIYEGNKSGIGKQTGKDQWQNNMATADYVPEIEKHFGDVVIRKGIIEAREPIASDVPSVWSFDGKFNGENEIRFRSIDITPEVRQEMENIEAMARINGTYMKAPNGADTKLNPEQWAMVRTQAFKDWFGDWENEDVLEEQIMYLDQNGEPRVFTHNTNASFTTFEKTQQTDAGWLGQGFYFYGEADDYIRDAYGKNQMEVFIKTENPYFISDDEYEELSTRDNREYSEEFTQRLIDEGYDSVYYNGNLNYEVCVFDPNQIKSATDNNGEFSRENNDIRFRASNDDLLNNIWNLEFDELSSLEIDSIVDAFRNGQLQNQRLRQEEQARLREGSRSHIVASLICRRYGTTDTEESFEQILKERNDQEQAIEAWAKEDGCWVGDPQKYLSERYDYAGRGGESYVYVDAENSLVVKANDLAYYATPEDLLDRITIHNTLFPETAMEVFGFGRTAWNSFTVLYTQPFVQGEPISNQEREEIFTNRFGFDKVDAEDYAYQTNDVYISDVHKDNVLRGENGIFVIDAKIYLNDQKAQNRRSLLDEESNESDSDSIFRAVTPEQDEAFRKAYEANDTAAAQQMVKDAFKAAFPNTKVVDENGEPLVVYHGSPSRFNRFDERTLGMNTLADSSKGGFFFTSSEDLADWFRDTAEVRSEGFDIFEENLLDYVRKNATQEGVEEFVYMLDDHFGDDDESWRENARERALEILHDRMSGYYSDMDELKSELQRYMGLDPTKTYATFLNIENPIIDDEFRDYVRGNVDSRMTDVIDRAKEEGNDGVIFTDINELGGRAPQYVVFNPAAIKSADPFTFDDNGELIPLSERFNPENEDIRFRAAFHGTNADFDKFESGHLLEGEGHLAHGAGVYVAMNEDRGRAYADKVAAFAAVKNGDVKHNGEPLKYRHIEEMNNWRNDLKDVPLDEIILEAFLWAKSIDLEKVDNALWNKYDYLEIHGYNGAGRVEEALDYFRQHKDEYTVDNQSRYLYSLEIPDDNGSNYLDEQKIYEGEEATGIKDRVTDSLVRNGVDVDSRSGVLIKSWNEEMANTDKFAGAYLYSLLAMEMNNGKNDLNETAEAASKILSDAGFVGIKYDGRIDGDCAVIFNPEDIEITDKTRFRAGDVARERKSDPDFVAPDVDVRFRMSKNNKATIKAWYTKAYPGDDAEMMAESLVAYIEDEFDDPTTQLAAAKWYIKGTIVLPDEDAYKVNEAVKVAKKHKVDPLSFNSPMEIIDTYGEFDTKEKPIDPDTVPTLHKAKEFKNGIVIYDVDESQESRENLRKIINTHFGKNSSPWCLLQGDNNGNLSEDSAYYWKRYNAYPKQVAFKDGKLIAFSANNRKAKVWWDRKDESHKEIPVVGKIEGDSLGRTATHLYDIKTGAMVGYTKIHKGDITNGVYESWTSLDQEYPSYHVEKKDGHKVGLEFGYTNGIKDFEAEYNKDGKYKNAAWYYKDGTLRKEFVTAADNGTREVEYFSSGKVSHILERAANGHLTYEVHYFPNGSLRHEIRYAANEKAKHGYNLESEKKWNEDGDLVSESHDIVSEDGKQVIRREWTGTLAERIEFNDPESFDNIFASIDGERMTFRPKKENDEDRLVVTESWGWRGRDYRTVTVSHIAEAYYSWDNREEEDIYYSKAMLIPGVAAADFDGNSPVVETKVTDHRKVVSDSFSTLEEGQQIPNAWEMFKTYAKNEYGVNINDEDGPRFRMSGENATFEHEFKTAIDNLSVLGRENDGLGNTQDVDSAAVLPQVDEEGSGVEGTRGSVDNVLFRFVGEQAAYALDQAYGENHIAQLVRAIHADGKADPYSIKLASGWEKVDGVWTYEEPDFPTIPEDKIKDGVRLGDIIEDERLFAEYPELADYTIKLTNTVRAGRFVPSSKQIEISRIHKEKGKTLNETQNLTLLHEVQHFIQRAEGWDVSVSKSEQEQVIKEVAPLVSADLRMFAEATKDAINEVGPGFIKYVINNKNVSALKDFPDNEAVEKYVSTYRFFWDKWGYKPTNVVFTLFGLTPGLRNKRAEIMAYEQDSTEVQARNVEYRSGMTEEQRRKSLYDDTVDFKDGERWIEKPFDNVRFRSVADSGDVANVIDRGIPQVSDVMMDLFADAPASVKNAVAEDAARNGFRFDNAMTNYLADRATRFDLTGDDKALMDAAVARISSAAGVPMNELDARWAMWNEAHRGDDTTVGLAQRIATGMELGHDPVSDEMKQRIADDVRFRAISSAHDDSALSIYGREMGFWFAINETWKNQFESVKVLQDAIAKAAGKDIQDFEDADNRLNLMPARIRDDKEKYVREFLNPMWDVIKALGLMGIKQKRIEEYVLAKSGLERNVLFAKRDAKAEYKKILDENLEKLKKYQSATPAVQAAMDNDLQKQINDAQQYIADRTNDLALATTPAEVRAINKDIAKAQKELDGLLLDQQRDAQAYTDDYDRHIIDVDMEVDEKYLENRKTDYSGLTSLYDEVPELKKRRGESPQEFRERVKSQTTHPFPKLEDAEFEAQLQVTLFEQDAEIFSDRMLKKIGKEPGKGVRYGHYQVGTDMAKELWDRINAATNEILRHQLEYGMINQETHDNLVNMMQYYVPLRGFDQETAEEAYSYKHEGSPVSVPVRKAKGRRSRAADPFANIAVMAESGITMDHKNHAKMALYNLVANTPENDAAQIAESWFEYTGNKDSNGKKIYRKVYPKMTADMTPAEVTAKWDDLNRDMEQRKANGEDVKHGKSELDLYNEVVFVDRNQKPEHVISVKVDGHDEDIIIQGNPRVAQAIEGKLNIESSDNPIYKVLSALTRLRAGLSTSWNPEFVETNFIRDAQTAFTTAFVEDGVKGVGDYLSAVVRCAKMYRLAANYEKTPLEKSVASGLSTIEKNHPQLVEWYKEFRESGATTGFSHLQDNAEYEDQLRKFTNPTAWEKVMLGISEKLEWLQFINDGVENLWRFAAYVNARENGKSIDTSAHAAKEITVNFNRKGSGLVWGPKDIKGLNLSENDAVRAFQQATIMLMTSPAPALRTAVMFVNATVQGLVKTMGLFEKSPFRATLSIGIGYFVFGAINSLLQQMGGDDDDDKQRKYLSLSEQERRENLSMRVPGLESGYVKIALPQEYRIFYALGDMVVSDMLLKNDPSESVVDKTWESLWELTPWNLSHWKDAGDVLRNSGVGPIYDVVKNENFMGMNVYNEKKYAQDDDKEFVPEWQYATRYADPVLVEICKWLSDITGGDELGFYAGKVDLNPDIVQAVLEGYAGGALTTLKKFGDVYNMATGKQEFTFRRTPFLSRLFADVEEKNSSTYVNGLYDFYMQELQHRFKALDGPTGYNKTDGVDAPKNLSNDPIARAYAYALDNGMIETSKQEKSVSDKKLKSLNETKKELQSKLDDPEPYLNIGYTEEEKQEYLDLIEQLMKENQDLINDHKWNFVRRLNEAYYEK